MLEAAGVVEWTGRSHDEFGSRTIPTGGRIRLTALGRHVVPDNLADAGYVLTRVDDLADATALRLIDALDTMPDEQRQAVVDTWQPGLDIQDRVGQIVDVIGSADDALLRLKGFAVLELFDDTTVGPAVRALLDGPAGGQAALYLMSRGWPMRPKLATSSTSAYSSTCWPPRSTIPRNCARCSPKRLKPQTSTTRWSRWCGTRPPRPPRIVAAHGNHLTVEDCRISTWARLWGKRIALFSPGMLVTALAAECAATGGRLHRAGTRSTALSQHCLCGARVPKTPPSAPTTAWRADWSRS